MRIAHVAKSISMNQIVLNQMAHQRARGHEVFALCPDDEWTEPLKAKGIQVIDVPYHGHSLAAACVAAVKTWIACVLRRFDVVHTHNALPGVTGRIAGRLAGVPVVLHTWHSWPARLPRPWYITLGFRLLEPLATAAADAVLFLNPDDLAVWSAMRGVAAGKARLIGNGINVEEFVQRVKPDARARIRREFGVGEETYLVVKVARIEHPRKGHVFFLEGLKRFRDRSPREAAALFVGAGDDEGVVRSAARRLGLEDVVRFPGYRGDIPDILAAADLSVLTSPFEGVPRALMESMALGVPVLGTDVPGTRMLVRSGESGLLVGLGDVAGLADALLQLSGDPALARRLGEAGRIRVREKFNEPEVAARILQIYEHALNERGQPIPYFDIEAES
jgi:glycosyltransferase involved in cell wall biosynthesis